MKRVLCGAAAALALGGAVAPTIALACGGRGGGGGGGETKVTFCHATSSPTNPYVKITTSPAALVWAHLRHHAERDVVPQFTYRGKSYGSAEGAAFVAAGCTTPGDGGGTGGGDGSF